MEIVVKYCLKVPDMEVRVSKSFRGCTKTDLENLYWWPDLITEKIIDTLAPNASATAYATLGFVVGDNFQGELPFAQGTLYFTQDGEPVAESEGFLSIDFSLNSVNSAEANEISSSSVEL